MAATLEKSPSENNQREDRPIPIRYIFAALGMLLLLVIGILTPDLLPYLGPKLGLTTPVAAQEAVSAPLQNPTMNVFETYARLVTLFLALVSVLGVFFGYFVRKSIRETEEEVDKRFDRNMALWEKEKDGLIKKYGEDATQLKSSLAVVDQLEQRLREALKESEAAKERYQKPPPPAAKEVTKASAELDAQLEPPTGAA